MPAPQTDGPQTDGPQTDGPQADGPQTDGPQSDGLVDDVLQAVKPRLRGWLHAGTFPLSVVAGIALVLLADGPRDTAATAVYATSAALLFGVSAIYHRGNWSPRRERLLKRLDHSNIFLIIAGTYTPFSVILLDRRGGVLLLWIVWSAALAGIAFRVLWVGAPRWLFTPVYIALGWVAVFYLGDILDAGGPAVVALLAVGGVLYSLGGVVYALKRPNPSPRWFGFHEVFHALTLGAYVTHYIALALATYRA
jgi:hemolysin III